MMSWKHRVASIALPGAFFFHAPLHRAVAQDPVNEAPQSLRVWLEAPASARAGALVPLIVRARNTGTRPLDLALRGRDVTLDVIVTRAGDEVVWRRLGKEIIPGILQLRTLAAGEGMMVEAEWRQVDDDGKQVAPGQYMIRASILTDGEPLETPGVAIRIVP